MKKRAALHFSERQLKQLDALAENLCECNRTTFRQLRQSTYRGASERQLRELGESLVNAAIYMTVLMQTGEHLINDAGDQVPGTVGVVFGVICGNCDDDPPGTPRDENSCGHPPYDPEWENEADALLHLVHSVATTFASGTLRRPLLTALSRLTRALLRQKRFLRKLGPQQDKDIDVKYDRARICMRCGRPVDACGATDVLAGAPPNNLIAPGKGRS
jgi:hypothetical protein